jgi:peptide deformylase
MRRMAVSEEPKQSRREREEAAQDEMRRLMALSQVRQYPDPVLRERARPVEEFSDDLAALVARMAAIMEDAHGVGLAATQLGLLRRLFVMRPGEDDEVVVVVNPTIVERSETVESDSEGCLSLGPVRVPVERNTAVTIEGVDATGAPLRIEAEGMTARVAQHEIDHLDGVLIVDRTTPEARREAMARLRPPVGSRS